MFFKIETNSAIDFTEKSTLELHLYNILGQKVGSYSQNIQLFSGYNEIQIPIKNYINLSGVYIIDAKINLEDDEDKYYSKKFTVIK